MRLARPLHWGSGMAREHMWLLDSGSAAPDTTPETLADRTDHPVTLLTTRQRGVASLLARGYTNQQVAEELSLTKGTVANHVATILRRLGFETRGQIIAWA